MHQCVLLKSTGIEKDHMTTRREIAKRMFPLFSDAARTSFLYSGSILRLSSAAKRDHAWPKCSRDIKRVLWKSTTWPFGGSKHDWTIGLAEGWRNAVTECSKSLDAKAAPTKAFFITHMLLVIRFDWQHCKRGRQPVVLSTWHNDEKGGVGGSESISLSIRK